jgi:hypothetical protein
MATVVGTQIASRKVADNFRGSRWWVHVGKSYVTSRTLLYTPKGKKDSISKGKKGCSKG